MLLRATLSELIFVCKRTHLLVANIHPTESNLAALQLIYNFKKFINVFIISDKIINEILNNHLLTRRNSGGV